MRGVETRKCVYAHATCLTRGVQRTIGDKFSPLSELPLMPRYTGKLIKHRTLPLLIAYPASMIRRSSNASALTESTCFQSKEREISFISSVKLPDN